jgi:ORF6N domain
MDGEVKDSAVMLADEIVISKIYFIRGQKVMLDADLAELYQVETKVLKQAIRRNFELFPIHFMFELTEQEFDILRSQFVTSKKGSGGTRYLPMVFTEYGILQISNTLKSKRARQMSIRIIEVFVKLRKMLTDNMELRLAIEQLERKSENHTKNLEIVFRYLDELMEKKENTEPRKMIGYLFPSKKEE